MKTRLALALAPSLLIVIGAGAACSSSDLCVGAACGGASDASTKDGTVGDDQSGDDASVHDGGVVLTDGPSGGDAVVPPGCDASSDIANQPACVTTSFGLFVSAAHGSDATGDGKQGTPFATIAKALAAADASHPSIFICAGTYAEHLVISTNVSLYGGFSCEDWTHPSAPPTKPVTVVAPENVGYALQLTMVTGSVFEDIEFDSKPGVAAGETSVAVFANAATGITFRRVTVKAGDAGPTPTKAATGANYVTGTAAGDGTTATGNSGVGVQTCASCADGEFSRGGASGNPGGNGSPGSSSPMFDGEDGGAGGSGTNCLGNGTGSNGAPSPSAPGGEFVADSGAGGWLLPSGWLALVSPDGGTAHAAQGGGGGAGGAASGGGGGGGCGGCGGGGGAGGMAGGSSFGVLSYKSTLRFDSCAIAAGGASPGGPGGDGQVGQTFGAGGSRTGTACVGGYGGAGGSGGGGAGGSGGLSVGVGYVGSDMPPILTNTTPTFSSTTAMGGAPGQNGSPAPSKGNDGTNAATLLLGSD